MTVLEMVIYGVSYDMVGKHPIVLLKTADGKRFLPIWIGSNEANAIMAKLRGDEASRPMTHDLLQSVVEELGGAVVRVAVTELRESTFYAVITVRQNGNEVEIDSRPSDAIALAVRVDAPIYAAEDVVTESAIEFDAEAEETEPETVVEDFRRFLEEVKPEDFARGPSEDPPEV
jgi:bifunctional DNase/RNase